MNDNMTFGLDAELDAKENTAEVIDITQEKPKRMPFVVWSVGGKDYRLKLSTSAICKLEKKYGRNVLLLVTEDGIPPISTMLTVLQAALSQYNHGITFLDVQQMYDTYIAEGGDQTKLLGEIIMPTLGVSGFFTQSQMDIMTAEMKEMDSAL